MAKLFREEVGYSLVEVMVAIMLLGLAILPMVSMFDAGLRAAVFGSNYDRARVAAGEELAEVQALPFDTSGDGTPDSVVEIYPPPGSPSACTDPPSFLSDCQVYTDYAAVGPSGIIEDADSRKMIKVRVVAKWDGGNNSYEATGLVVEESL